MGIIGWGIFKAAACDVREYALGSVELTVPYRAPIKPSKKKKEWRENPTTPSSPAECLELPQV